MSLLPMSTQHQEYLRDESRLIGWADSISFPDNVAQLSAEAAQLFAQRTSITVQGARTGICGAAVPHGGHILNLQRLNHISGLTQDATGNFHITVQAGVTLSELQTALQQRSFDTTDWDTDSLAALQLLRQAPEQQFAPNPTEGTATFGGLFCCNAKGINACAVGSIAEHVTAAKLLLADGSRWQIARGQYIFDQSGCCLLPDGRTLALCAIESPVFGGFTAAPGSDLLDLFAASEGMLGIVLSLTLRLCPTPQSIWGIVFFFAAQPDCSRFLDSLIAYSKQATGARLVAAELFDTPSLTRIAEQKKHSSRLREIPDCPPTSQFAVYCEVAGDDEQLLEEALLELSELFADCNGDENDTWAACGLEELEKFRLFRHTAPESANLAIDQLRLDTPEMHKVCADYTLPTDLLTTAWARYQTDIQTLGVPGMVFGHILSGRLHINLFPHTCDALARCHQQLAAWADWVVAEGGQSIGENGIGKLKADIWHRCAQRAQLQNMQKAKAMLDPHLLLNLDNMQTGGAP